jgi:hypothetical protein
MRLTTILNPFFPMTLRERVHRIGEWSVMEIAWHLPRYLVYWVVVRGTAATAGDHRNPADVKGVEILHHYEQNGRPRK